MGYRGQSKGRYATTHSSSSFKSGKISSSKKSNWSEPPLTKKGEVNFERMGYLMAKGAKGTNWMALTDSELKEYLEIMQEAKSSGNDPYEALDEKVSGWLETLQWEHEVGRFLPKFSDDTVDDYLDSRTEWVAGYEEYIFERLRKEYATDLKKIFPKL